MTALRPPTRAVMDENSGTWVSGPVPGSLTEPVDPAPVEAPDEHPVVAALYPRTHQRTPAEVLDEEAYEWARDPELLTDTECTRAFAVGIDVNTAFLAAANRLVVGLGAPSMSRIRLSTRRHPGAGWSTCPAFNSTPECRTRSRPTEYSRTARPGTRHLPSPTPRNSSTPTTSRSPSARWRHGSAPSPALTWTPGTSTSARRTSRRWPTSASPPVCPTPTFSPSWSTTSRPTPAWRPCSRPSSRRSRGHRQAPRAPARHRLQVR